MKTPIADGFRAWEKSASLEEKQKFCDEINLIASVLRQMKKTV